MISTLVLLLACAGSPADRDQALPARAALHGVELRLPERGLLLRAAHAETPPSEPGQGEASEVVAELGSEPGLAIQSEYASWDLREHHVVFEGRVRAVRGAFELSCERLEASFDSPEQLRSAVATGEVTVRHRGRVAAGQRAVLDIEAGRLELEGQPSVREGERSLRGERIVLFLDDERLECERCSLEIATEPTTDETL